jgi:hypothetical protein
MLIAYDTSASLNTSQITLAPRAVLIKQQLRGPSQAHSIEHLLEGVATCKEQQQYGDIRLGGILP